MVALCPDDDIVMKRAGTSKRINATEYYCPMCGQHWTKVKGERGYHKGQIFSLPQEYFKRK